jgi:hypothetical protein
MVKWGLDIPKCEESHQKVKAALPLFEVRRFGYLGRDFSLSGLRYSLRKPLLSRGRDNLCFTLVGQLCQIC